MKLKLSEDLKKWRAERPDEWTMDRFIEKAEELEKSLKAIEQIINCTNYENEY
jgi:hypothetical protein